MDTATHIAIGVGLTALATQDPAMASIVWCNSYNPYRWFINS